jgi:hypothetical protein
MLVAATVLDLLIVISATTIAVVRPQWFIRTYPSVRKILTWVGVLCITWAVLQDASTIRLVLGVIQDTHRTPESALQSIQRFAFDAIHTQRAFIGSSLILLVVVFYLGILARFRTSTSTWGNPAA